MKSFVINCSNKKQISVNGLGKVLETIDLPI